MVEKTAYFAGMEKSEASQIHKSTKKKKRQEQDETIFTTELCN